jgi:DNA-binding NtrC family response regulator
MITSDGKAGARILLVDDDRAFRLSTAELLREDGHEVIEAENGAQAAQALQAGLFDLMLLDLRMPGLDGLRMVEVLRERGEPVPILMVSGFGTVESAVESLHLGADDFLMKPVDPDVLSARVGEILDRRPTRASLSSPVEGMVGRSLGMRRVFDAIRRVAPTETTVLITGETGTGKELVARAVHGLSERSGHPFIPVNCASLAEGVLESELFGHVRGAFTGAVRDKTGLFAAADGGTIFLDEIGDMGLQLQQRLLRVIQEREVTPVGAVRAFPVNVRVVAATNRDLRAETAAGRFREDLFYRLNVFHVHLPPLRERRGDIPLLIEAALRRLRDRSSDAQHLVCSPFAIRLLRAYDWPGNVRELFSVIESAAIRSGGRIEAQYLPDPVRGAHKGGALPSQSGEPERYQGPDDESEERQVIVAALQEVAGVRSRAAQLLGMSRTTLWRKLKQYGIEPD